MYPRVIFITEVRLPRRATLGHGCREGVITSCQCYSGTLVSLYSNPRLGRLDETAQLFEQGAGGSTVALERFDPVEPGQYCASLVHVTKLARGSARVCHGTVPSR
jgi:hypothetical protein